MEQARHHLVHYGLPHRPGTVEQDIQAMIAATGLRRHPRAPD